MKYRVGSALRLVERDVFVLLAVLVAQALLTIAGGVALSPDSQVYASWADELVATKFHFGEYFRSESFRLPQALRLGFIVLVALSKVIFGGGWAVALVALNHLASAFTGVLLLRIVCSFTRKLLPAWFALAAYVVSYEVASWNRFVLTDEIFLLLSFALYFVLARLLERHDRRVAPAWLYAFLLLLAALLIRPTAVVLIGCFAFSVVLWFIPRYGAFPAAKILVSFAILVACLWWVAARIAEDPGRWPVPLFAKQAGSLKRNSSQGQVVDQRPETYGLPPRNAADYFALYTDRFRHFFHVRSRGFSRSHKVYNVLWFYPTYAFGALGLLLLLRKRVAERGDAAILLSFLTLLAFAVFHGMTILDFDWRYRLPVIPHVILLASYGLSRIDTHLLGRSSS